MASITSLNGTRPPFDEALDACGGARLELVNPVKHLMAKRLADLSRRPQSG